METALSAGPFYHIPASLDLGPGFSISEPIMFFS